MELEKREEVSKEEERARQKKLIPVYSFER